MSNKVCKRDFYSIDLDEVNRWVARDIINVINVETLFDSYHNSRAFRVWYLVSGEPV